MAAACLLLGRHGTPGQAPRGHRPRGRISLRPTATSHLFVVDDSAMPAAFVLLEALPADSPATDLLVTTHGSNSRPAPTGAPATSLVWMSRAVTLEMLSDLHLADGTAAYLFGERQPADSTPKQKDMRLWMSVVSGARLGSRLGSSDPERLCAWYAELGETALSALAVLLDALDVGEGCACESTSVARPASRPSPGTAY